MAATTAIMHSSSGVSSVHNGLSSNTANNGATTVPPNASISASTTTTTTNGTTDLGSSANSPDSSCPTENLSNRSTSRSSSEAEEDDAHHLTTTTTATSKSSPTKSDVIINQTETSLVNGGGQNDAKQQNDQAALDEEEELVASPKAPTITPPPSSAPDDNNDDNSTIIGEDDEAEDDCDNDSQASVEIDAPRSNQSSVADPKPDADPLPVLSQSTAAIANSVHLVNESKSTTINAINGALLTNTVVPPSKKFSTGKLEKITAALAKKQSNGQVPTNLLESLASLRESTNKVEPPLAIHSNGMSAAFPSQPMPTFGGGPFALEDGDGDVDDDDDDDEDGLEEDEMVYGDDEDLDDEDEEIKNGFRALGLMGNVAFMGEEKFKCPVCSLQLDSQHTFTLHIRSHNPNDHSNTCRLCGKTLSSASSLDRHMLIHSGERPFKCSICNMAFTTNGNMHRHMRTHGHGTIGYTPRGAKRRAKLFAQQAAKLAAAALAGEPVDAAVISKLKKSEIEVRTGNGKSPISGTPMKKQRSSGGGRRSTSDPFGGAAGNFAADSLVTNNPAETAKEVERIATSAAAYAASVATNSEAKSGHGGHKAHHKNTQHQQQQHSMIGSSHLQPHNSHHHQQALQQQQHHNHQRHHSMSPPGSAASPLAALAAAGWPDLVSLAAAAAAPSSSANNNVGASAATTPNSVILPPKGKPGRKKKVRPSDAPQLPMSHSPHLTQQLQAALQSQLQQNTSHHHHQLQPPQLHMSECSDLFAFSNELSRPSCPICSHPMHTKTELHVHMSNFHQSEKLFCLDCGMILDNYEVYTDHRCTMAATTVMTAMATRPHIDPEPYFRSTNTSRMNFSSARFQGSQAAANVPLQPLSQTAESLNSFFSQLKSLQQQQQQQQSSNASFLPHLQTPQSQLNSRSSGSSTTGLVHPGFDLSAAAPAAHSKSYHNRNSSGGGQACGQCQQKFPNTKQLKLHIDTYCHECGTDCGHEQNLKTHQLQHTFEKFPNALSGNGTNTAATNGNGAGDNAFNSAAIMAAAAAFPSLLNQMNPALMATFSGTAFGNSLSLPNAGGAQAAHVSSKRDSMTPSPHNNYQHKRHSYHSKYLANSANSGGSLDLVMNSSNSSPITTNALLNSSIASLTSTMADMKPDLADIQSIISMTKHAKLPSISNGITNGATASNSNNNTNSGYKSSMSLSPNRASDAGVDTRKAVRSGDATNQPDSPPAADSAAAVVVASTSGSSHSSTTSGSQLPAADHHVKQHEGAKTTNNNNNNSDNIDHDDSYLDEDDLDMGELDADTSNNKTPGKSATNNNKGGRGRRRSNSGSPLKSADEDHQSSNGKHDHSFHGGHNNTNGGSSSSGDQQQQSPSSGPRFRCDQCKLSFKSMNAFRRHNRGHTAGGGHSHACHLCPYKSLDKSTLIRHLRTHNGERPFQCSICKYAFTTKANCERHVRKRHRDLKSKREIQSAMQNNRDMAATAAATKLVSEKIFIERDELPTSQDTVCKQCTNDFGTNRELRSHLRVPNNPCSQQLKPFVCTICKIGFNTRNNCVRHIIKQHPATIEVTDEEAAKVVAAAGDATTESLLAAAENGSNASLSPNSGGRLSGGHSVYSDRSFGSGSGSDHGLSECESYGTFDEDHKSSPLVSPNSNASFAALCQVAAVEKRLSNGGSKSPDAFKPKMEHSKPPTAVLNLTTKSEPEDTKDGADVLDLSRPKRRSDALHSVSNGLDLSVKIPKLSNGHFIKSESPEASPIGHFRGRQQQQQQHMASNLLTMYAAANQYQQHQPQRQAQPQASSIGANNIGFDINKAMAAFATPQFAANQAIGQMVSNGPVGGGFAGFSNETLANLMAQFHQHQYAAASGLGNKNH